jgi:CO/xanthine dehydrogenase FAD-binding subunit
MLLNLKTIHKPDSLDDARQLLAEPGTYPLYGGAALQRRSDPAVEAVVDLSRLGLDYVQDSENSLRLGTMLTLEQVRLACLERAGAHPRIGAIATLLAEEMPETLRNTLTLGDLLVERNPQSPTLTLFLALGGILRRIDVDMHFTVSAWLTAPADVARYLIAHIRFARGPRQAAVAYEKVARTPADAPIVAAVACAEPVDDEPNYRAALAVCGASPVPVPQRNVTEALYATGDIDTALDELLLDPPNDHWGSAEYRAAMARVLSRRVLVRALEAVKQVADE